MLTTRRTESDNVYCHNNGGIDLLERNPLSYEAYSTTPDKEENFEEAKMRMERNLQRLLNYDKLNENIEEKTEEVVLECKAVSEENDDIKPSSTTMQFGDGNAEILLNEMEQQSKKERYTLNKKGKFFVFCYGLVVSVIFALIVLNTSVLAVLSRENVKSQKVLSDNIATYNALCAKIDSISSDDYVINVAENEFGMEK